MEEPLYNFKQEEKLSVDIVAIAKIATCFDEKFGVPRQSGLIPEAKGCIRFCKSEEYRQALFGLEACTHVWLITWFDKIDREQVKPRVRPPRLGGEKSLGVFATRSPFRPNPIGLSLVELDEIKETKDALEIWVKGVDLVDGTPILDIKPYLPYSEAHVEAQLGWVDTKWEALEVVWSREAELQVEELGLDVSFKRMSEAVLKQDPRPAYQRDKKLSQTYGMSLSGKNLEFSVEDGVLTVDKVTQK